MKKIALSLVLTCSFLCQGSALAMSTDEVAHAIANQSGSYKAMTALSIFRDLFKTHGKDSVKIDALTTAFVEFMTYGTLQTSNSTFVPPPQRDRVRNTNVTQNDLLPIFETFLSVSSKLKNLNLMSLHERFNHAHEHADTDKKQHLEGATLLALLAEYTLSNKAKNSLAIKTLHTDVGDKAQQLSAFSFQRPLHYFEDRLQNPFDILQNMSRARMENLNPHPYTQPPITPPQPIESQVDQLKRENAGTTKPAKGAVKSPEVYLSDIETQVQGYITTKGWQNYPTLRKNDIERARACITLNLDPNKAELTQKEVNDAYKGLSIAYHPDRNNDPKAGDVFNKLKEASDFLKSNLKNTATSFTPSFGFTSPLFSDSIFSDIFSRFKDASGSFSPTAFSGATSTFNASPSSQGDSFGNTQKAYRQQMNDLHKASIQQKKDFYAQMKQYDATYTQKENALQQILDELNNPKNSLEDKERILNNHKATLGTHDIRV